MINGGLPNDILKSNKIDLPQSGVVLQIVNVRNVSAPKINQESKTSPRLLQIDLTDGQTVCSGLDLEYLSAFSINIAPGTKVLLKNSVKINQGFLIFTPQNINIIGGQVQALYEKWETNRTLLKYAGPQGLRKLNNESLKGSPPPWISFGNKIKNTNESDSSVKSLSAAKPKEISKEESEFLAMRESAIAEAATKGELRKHFGGSSRQLMDHNVKKILDKGYTEDQARLALKVARNNLERAMSHLKKRGSNEMDQRKQRPSTETHRDTNSRRRNRSNDPPPAKPSGKVSLFDFLSDKIPDVEPQPTQSSSMQPKLNPRNNNNNNSNDCAPNSKIRNSGQYQSNHSSIENHRASKFENNISSTFASRQKKDESHIRSKWSDNNAADKNPNKSTPQQYQSMPHHSSSYKSSQQNSHMQQNTSSTSNYHQNSKNTRYTNSANDVHNNQYDSVSS